MGKESGRRRRVVDEGSKRKACAPLWLAAQTDTGGLARYKQLPHGAARLLPRTPGLPQLPRWTSGPRELGPDQPNGPHLMARHAEDRSPQQRLTSSWGQDGMRRCVQLADTEGSVRCCLRSGHPRVKIEPKRDHDGVPARNEHGLTVSGVRPVPERHPAGCGKARLNARARRGRSRARSPLSVIGLCADRRLEANNPDEVQRARQPHAVQGSRTRARRGTH